MFGYVTIDKLELKVKDYYRYHAYYCGLCKVLKDRHGRFGQMTLTYDMTFLIILLTSLYELENRQTKKRCLAHPVKSHSVLLNEMTEYAADMNIAMAYHNFMDDWKDEKKTVGLAGMELLKRKYVQIHLLYPRQCLAVEAALKELGDCEARKEFNLDIVSDCFGKLMAELLVYREDQWQDTLRDMGVYLGKFIYLLDAYEDLEKDRRKGIYNPLFEISKEADYEETCEEILKMIMAECVRNFEKLPLIQDVEILRNILYTGVWVKFKALKERKC